MVSLQSFANEGIHSLAVQVHGLPPRPNALTITEAFERNAARQEKKNERLARVARPPYTVPVRSSGGCVLVRCHSSLSTAARHFAGEAQPAHGLQATWSQTLIDAEQEAIHLAAKLIQTHQADCVAKTDHPALRECGKNQARYESLRDSHVGIQMNGKQCSNDTACRSSRCAAGGAHMTTDHSRCHQYSMGKSSSRTANHQAGWGNDLSCMACRAAGHSARKYQCVPHFVRGACTLPNEVTARMDHFHLEHAVARNYHNSKNIGDQVPVVETKFTRLSGHCPSSVVSADGYRLVVHLPSGLRGKTLVRVRQIPS